MVHLSTILALVSVINQVQSQATEEEQSIASVAFFTYSSKDVTYTIYISPSTAYAVGGRSATNELSKQQQDKNGNLNKDETLFSATDAAGSVTVLPGSIVPSDVMSSLMGSSLPTVLVTATDPSPTPISEKGGAPDTLTLSTTSVHSGMTTALPLTWTVTQNGTTKTVVPTTTNIHQSTQSASVGSMKPIPVELFVFLAVAGIVVW